MTGYYQTLQAGKTSTVWENHFKELDILFFNLVHKSDHEVLTLTIKIYLKKKIQKQHSPVQSIRKSGNFQEFLIPGFSNILLSSIEI